MTLVQQMWTTTPLGDVVAPDPSVEDDRLMAQFCIGHEAAFDEIYRRHATSVHSFLRRMVGQPDLADDLLQNTFFSVVRARGRYLPGTSLRSWIFTIAANTARDARRRARVRADLVRAHGVDEGSVDPIHPDPPAARALQQALADLPDDQREAVLLHKMQGLGFAEVAEVLGISVGAAKVRAHRGYEKLRARLGALEETT